jgi:hypothetical protein
MATAYQFKNRKLHLYYDSRCIDWQPENAAQNRLPPRIEFVYQAGAVGGSPLAQRAHAAL